MDDMSTNIPTTLNDLPRGPAERPDDLSPEVELLVSVVVNGKKVDPSQMRTLYEVYGEFLTAREQQLLKQALREIAIKAIRKIAIEASHEGPEVTAPTGHTIVFNGDTVDVTGTATHVDVMTADGTRLASIDLNPPATMTSGSTVSLDSLDILLSDFSAQRQRPWNTRYNEDNLYDSLSKRYTKALARSMAYTKQTKAAAVLNNAFDASYTGGDGVELCSTLHPLANGGVNSNEPATSADLNEASLEAAQIQIAAWTDERGLLIAAKPAKLILPPALKFTAIRILETEKRVSTADNDVNALRTNGTISGGYTINDFLTDTDAWFLTTDIPDGLKHFKRVALSTGMDGDFDTGNVRYKARERYSFGWSDPLAMFGSPGAA